MQQVAVKYASVKLTHSSDVVRGCGYDMCSVVIARLKCFDSPKARSRTFGIVHSRFNISAVVPNNMKL